MAESTRQILCRLIAEGHVKEGATNSLTDLSPGAKAEIRVLKDAYAYVSKLEAAGAQIHDTLVAGIGSGMATDLGRDVRQCQWAIETWALALGKRSGLPVMFSDRMPLPTGTVPLPPPPVPPLPPVPEPKNKEVPVPPPVPEPTKKEELVPPPPPPVRTGWPTSAKAIVGLAAVLLGGLVWMYRPKMVAVPNVKNMDAYGARKAVEAKHLKLVVTPTPVYDESVPIYEVVSVYPPEGTRVHEEEAVTIVLSAGSRPVEVPDVAKKSISEATAILRDMKLNVDSHATSQYRYSEEIPAYSVVATEPSARTSVAKNTTVQLILSAGSAISDVPNMVGWTLERAKSQLSSLGLEVGDPIIKVTNRTNLPAGTVVAQSRLGRVYKGSTVTLSVTDVPASPSPSAGWTQAPIRTR